MDMREIFEGVFEGRPQTNVSVGLVTTCMIDTWFCVSRQCISPPETWKPLGGSLIVNFSPRTRTPLA